ncbi:heat shock factor protein-like isoform X2 [Ptychodera flava]|uniref:heat shock factor protein-like isoform X2 n=1 Tax=Ptychodera flava TaxID=63121 RepID=UPI00396A7343
MPTMDSTTGSTVPAFLTKLLALVEDPKTDDLIRWSSNGSTFIIGDQARFSKEVLPRYFKHNNIASFIRQLNMYGFRKMVGIETGGLKSEKDETEFYHPHFVKGQPEQLEQIRRKVSTSKGDEVKVKHGDVTRVLSEVKQMKGKQENLDTRLDTMKRENEALWREVAELRQKHAKQQTIVNRLIQFLLSLVQTSRTGLKRRLPLMLADVPEAPSSKAAKFERLLSIEPTTSGAYEVQSMIEEVLKATKEATLQPPSVASSGNPTVFGPVISDVTDLVGSDDANVQTELISQSPTSPRPTATSTIVTGTTTTAVQESAPSAVDSALSGQVELQNVLARLSSPDAQELPNVFATGIPSEETELIPENLPIIPLESLLVTEGDPLDLSCKKPVKEEREPTTETSCKKAVKEEREPTTETLQLHEPVKKDEKHLQVAVSQSPKVRNDLTEHCDSVQSNLDLLQGLLSGGTYSLDPNSLVELFNPSTDDFPLAGDSLSMLRNLTDDSLGSILAGTSNSTEASSPAAGNIIGNELTTYSAPSRNVLEDFDIPSLYDLTDESNPIFDNEEPDEKASKKLTVS